jgi:hypothetical protein
VRFVGLVHALLRAGLHPIAYTAAHMRRVIWPFIVWLLAFALPAQGLAAATMLHCAPLRNDAAQSTHAGHDHHGNAHHDAALAQDQHGAAAGLDATHAADEDAGHVGTLHKCSACAACSVGLALPTSAQPVPAPSAAPTARPEPATVHAAFLTTGPERPPRAQRA